MNTKVQEELGLGISVYFMTLKQMIIFFVICTVLSIPSFVFFSAGTKGDDLLKDSQVFFSAMTLGNLGQSSTTCEAVPLTKQLV